MQAAVKSFWAAWLALALVSFGVAQAQQPLERQARNYSQAELDQLLAPVALYPDALLSQLMMAATYPLEVVQAARWSRANPNVQGDEAVRAVGDRDWDPSVKSMVAFPQLLQNMDERLEWTERLGHAFLAQEEQVMGTVQALRERADRAGNLRSSDELVVRREGEYIMLDPPTPERVYVPYYDTRVVYGGWRWPEYQPYVWAPWAGYSWSPGYSVFGWGLGVPVGGGFFYGTFDWPRRYVRYGNVRPWYHHGYHHGGGRHWNHGERWRHDHTRPASTYHRGNPNWRDGRRDGRRDDRPQAPAYRATDGRRDYRDVNRDGVRDGNPDGGRDRNRDGTRDRTRDGNRVEGAPRQQEGARPIARPSYENPRMPQAAPTGEQVQRQQPPPVAQPQVRTGPPPVMPPREMPQQRSAPQQQAPAQQQEAPAQQQQAPAPNPAARAAAPERGSGGGEKNPLARER